MGCTNVTMSQGFNAPEILAKLDAIEKACKDLRKLVLQGLNVLEFQCSNVPNTPETLKPALRLGSGQTEATGTLKPSKKFEYNDSTFLYECIDETRNQRLTALFVGLKQLQMIDERTSQKQFIDLFSGQPLYHRIKWTGGKAQLAYLFKQLIKQKKYVTTPGSRIWITVRSHFVQVTGQPFDEDIKAQQMPGEKPAANIDFLVELLNPGKALPSVRPSRRD